MHRRLVFIGVALSFLAGCSGTWETAYEEPVDPAVARSWTVTDVFVAIPESLSVSNDNTYAPNADIVWHGEPLGDRRAQVTKIMEEGLAKGAAKVNGSRRVTLLATVQQFHAVTPISVARAPAAVHNIRYATQVIDATTREPLTEPQIISADLEAFVGASAITAAIEGNTQRVRIVDHLARVTSGWLGTGPDQRRTFTSVGR